MVCRCLGRHSRVAIAAAVCTLRDQALFAWAMRTHLVACSRLSSRPRLQIGNTIACDHDFGELAAAVTAIGCP